MKPNTQSGLTLFEMVVVVGIVGTLLGLYLSFYKPTQDARATAVTKQRIEKILDQLASHALRMNYLPCPAHIEASRITGEEYREDDNCRHQPGNTHNNVFRGIIPYSTLGLSQEEAKDGFGRYMTYMVWGNTARRTMVPADRIDSEFCNNATSDLSLYRQQQHVDVRHRPVAAIIAYGPEGIGGFNMSASNSSDRRDPLGKNNLSSLGGDVNQGERRNAVDRNPNRIDINAYSLQSGSNRFDDVVGYMTKQGVITRMGVTYCGGVP